MIDLRKPNISYTTNASGAFVLQSGQVTILEDDPAVTVEARTPVQKKVIPEGLFSRYMNAAMKSARIEPDDGKWFAEIPGFQGLWAEGDGPERTLGDLREALEDWLLLKIEDEDRDLPVLANINLNVI